ncbi:DDB1- and CUL4-associated factor 17 isoform X1 [Neopelma chrysocephalum]|uniref:DDB1- and CUL4-associated factor 17 isoform X1 n=1 Tax=Neopelma chrysocephalum TaxID=114329 RepID=UPI000FCD0321|nr:DDB1- and CUL4-associated factor 17 isoform X1 [Neopelma chrysocephalum]
MCPQAAPGRVRAAPRAPGPHNVCRVLARRAHGFYARDAGVAHRKNLGLLRKIMCQESTKFKNVWTTHSASPIAYERGRIYMDNYQCCISSIAQAPRILYQKSKCAKSEKIEDALLLECPLGEMLPSPSDYKASLIVLTVQNWLLRLSADSGEVLEKIYLAGSCCKSFRYLSWDTPQEVMVVKTIQNKLPAAARQAGIQQSVLFYLAVFQVLPLSFIGMLEINKKIFGNSVTDVAVSNGILIVMYSVGLVRLYNFKAILEQFMEQPFDLGQEFNWNGQVGVVGKYPFGLPCNIKITDTPPLLFEASSLENAFQIGGYPWHYIITPNKKKHKGVFHICSLKDNALAKNGIQDMKCCSLEPDWIYFHPDMSGRIIHVGPNLIKVLKLKEVKNRTDQMEIAEDFTIVANRENSIIVYRLPWTWKCSKLLMKFIHAGLNTIAMILAIVAMVAAFEYHNAQNIANMYSLHSWIGLTAVIFYSLQLFLGFAVFLLPFAPVYLRAVLMPIHVYAGLTIFATVIATALMGITEKLIFSLRDPGYSGSPPEATFVNCLGLLLVVFGLLILWMATRPHWKRPVEENTKVLRPIGGTPEGTEVESTMTSSSNADKSDLRINSEAARKQNLKFDEAGQRSTM